MGSELTQGVRLDTNTAEIARELSTRGFRVDEALSMRDEVDPLADALKRLTTRHELVVVTGGLGPTHDDVTREAAALALGLTMHRDEKITRILAPVVARHMDPAAAAQVLGQAAVLQGAEVILPTTGTAPGQVVGTSRGSLALLPGPPSEMRPMLARLLARFPLAGAEPRELGVVGLSESDAQVLAQEALAGFSAIGLTVLARPGDVKVLLIDEGAGADVLEQATEAVLGALGSSCYSSRGESLAETVLRLSRDAGLRLATAESCTGGMVGAAITDVPGSSDVYLGGIIAYADTAKARLLGVDEGTLSAHGAVSSQVAEEMAAGALHAFGADVAVSITGIAGPGGGTAEKPVGLVWFGVAAESGGRSCSYEKMFSGGSRESVRQRATSYALDLLRTEALRHSR